MIAHPPNWIPQPDGYDGKPAKVDHRITVVLRGVTLKGRHGKWDCWSLPSGRYICFPHRSFAP